MNCLIIDGDQHSSKPLEKVIKKSPHLKLVAKCNSAEQAQDVFQNNRIDVIFIDGRPKDAPTLQKYVKENKPHVIAVSSVSEMGKVQYDFNVEDFILQPVSRVQLSRIINKIILSETVDSESGDETSIFIKISRNFHKIPIKHIQYVQALSDYVRIHTQDKVYTTYSTMKEMQHRLPEKDFVRVHRSYIVRLEAISSIQDGFITVDKKLIPIGKMYKPQLIARLNIQ